MKSQWDFFFECKNFRFDRVYKYEGKIGSEQATAFGLPSANCVFLITIEPDSESKFPGADQTGKLKVLIPGNTEQTKDLAYWIAINSSEHISFFHGELKIHGGLVTAELIPETPEEEEQLGENRFFAEARLVEVQPAPEFDGSSFQQITGDPIISGALRQYNAALKAENPIDQFLGLFRILESFYGPQLEKQTLAVALKSSAELRDIAQKHLTFSDGATTRQLTEDDYFDLVDKLVQTRHECAHLRAQKGFGIHHGDPKVRKEVMPLIKPLSRLAFETIRTRLQKASSAP